MPSLRELQDAMRSSIVDGEDARASVHVALGRDSARERLAIYRNTFTQTLTRALRLSHPAVDRLVGKDFFDAAARDFIVAQPPSGSWLDDFGGEFAAFLERFAPAASVPYLGDVARLEWAVGRALHAPDATALSMAQLESLSAFEHPRICFVPHPSVSLVRTAFPADAIWRAVLNDDDAALAALDLASGPAWLLVQRGAAGVEVSRLDEPQWHFVGALCAGRPLGVALNGHPEVDATTALAELLAWGRVVDFSLASDAVALEH